MAPRNQNPQNQQQGQKLPPPQSLGGMNLSSLADAGAAETGTRIAGQSSLLQSYLDAVPFRTLVPLSALENDGVDRLLDEIAALLPEGETWYDPAG